MTKRSTLLAFTALVSLSAGMAQAQAVAIDGEVTRNKIETAYAAYDFIDIRYGLTQVKVQAVDNDTNRKVEAVYDKATGRLIKAEEEAAGDDAGRTGVVTRSLTRDFEDDGMDDNTSDDDGIDDSTGGDDNTSDDNTSDDNTSGDDDNSGSGSDDDGDDSTGGDDD